jgi:hypothetical protein
MNQDLRFSIEAFRVLIINPCRNNILYMNIEPAAMSQEKGENLLDGMQKSREPGRQGD